MHLTMRFTQTGLPSPPTCRFSPAELHELKKSSMARVLCDNLIDDGRSKGRRLIANRNSQLSIK